MEATKALSEAKQQEYVTTIMHDKELAIAELEAARSLFNQKLQKFLEEKFKLESKLILAKQDVVELAAQVEKLSEIAFQQATTHILEDAQLRVSAAETSAAEAAYRIEEKIRNATGDVIVSIVEQAKDAIEKALAATEAAGDHTTKTMAAFTGSVDQETTLESSRRKTLQQEGAIESLLRRFEALQRSLKASETTSKLWRQRAEMAGSLLLKERSLRDCDENDVSYIVNGGRINLMMHDDSQKWKLLGDGPRRETPD
ncbi:alpha-amylase [Sarracenia purpurea var. burkii]